MSVSDSDYSTYIEILRSHLAKGTQPSGEQSKKLIAILENAVSKTSGDDTTYAAVVAATTDVAAKTVTLAATIVTQLGILQAFTDISFVGGAGLAAIDTADTALTADKTALVTAKNTLSSAVTANTAAVGTTPTYTANTGLDG